MPFASPAAARIVALALPLLSLSACGDANEVTVEPDAPASEWVASDPADPGVPVTLPSTPITNVPPTDAPSPAQ
jgi:hypothetical protein